MPKNIVEEEGTLQVQMILYEVLPKRRVVTGENVITLKSIKFNILIILCLTLKKNLFHLLVDNYKTFQWVSAGTNICHKK